VCENLEPSAAHIVLEELRVLQLVLLALVEHVAVPSAEGRLGFLKGRICGGGKATPCPPGRTLRKCSGFFKQNRFKNDGNMNIMSLLQTAAPVVKRAEVLCQKTKNNSRQRVLSCSGRFTCMPTLACLPILYIVAIKEKVCQKQTRVSECGPGGIDARQQPYTWGVLLKRISPARMSSRAPTILSNAASSGGLSLQHHQGSRQLLAQAPPAGHINC
jgi:hypothetical protein